MSVDGARNQEPDGDTRRRDNDLDRSEPSDRRNTLRPVSLVYCIDVYDPYDLDDLDGLSPEGDPCLSLYSLGVALQVGVGLDLFGYMVSIYKEYDIYHIQKDLPSLPRCLLIALRCTPTKTRHRRP